MTRSMSRPLRTPMADIILNGLLKRGGEDAGPA